MAKISFSAFAQDDVRKATGFVIEKPDGKFVIENDGHAWAIYKYQGGRKVGRPIEFKNSLEAAERYIDTITKSWE